MSIFKTRIILELNFQVFQLYYSIEHSCSPSCFNTSFIWNFPKYINLQLQFLKQDLFHLTKIYWRFHDHINPVTVILNYLNSSSYYFFYTRRHRSWHPIYYLNLFFYFLFNWLNNIFNTFCQVIRDDKRNYFLFYILYLLYTLILFLYLLRFLDLFKLFRFLCFLFRLLFFFFLNLKFYLFYFFLNNLIIYLFFLLAPFLQLSQ